MAVFSDTFTGSTGTQLQSHTPDTGTSWTRLWGSVSTLDWVINASNQATPETDADDGVIYTADATYPSADYKVEWDLVAGPGSSARTVYAMVRIQDQENMYAVRLISTASGSQLYKKVSGTWTALGSTFTVPANGSVCRLEIIGSALKFYDDGVEIASATDTDISAAGKAGLGAGGGAELVTSTDDSNASNIWDNFVVTSLGGTAYNQTVAGTLTSAGTVARVTNKLLAGTLTSGGALFRDVSKSLSGTLTSTGAVFRDIQKSFSGTLTSSGALEAARAYFVSVGGTLTSAGTLARETAKSLAGALTSSGSIARSISKNVSGTLSSTGMLNKLTSKFMSGVAALAGLLTSIFVPAGSGALDFTDTGVTFESPKSVTFEAAKKVEIE